jgi:hypothetical protein
MIELLYYSIYFLRGPPLIRFPALSHFLRSIGSGTGSTQPREYSRGVNGVICVAVRYELNS